MPRHQFHGAQALARRAAGAEPRRQVHGHLLRRVACTTPSASPSTCCYDGLAAGPHARAANYLEAVGIDADGVRVRDTVTGDEFAITADVVVNTSGPWTDLTNAGARPRRRAFMGGTKGSHIVLDHPELLAATDGREIFFEHEDGRIVLIYPLKGRVMVGTTDLEHDMREPAVCTEDEVDYFFELIAHVFPAIAVDRSQIVYRFSGVRPLPRHDDTQPGFVSRDYRIERARCPGAAGQRRCSASSAASGPRSAPSPSTSPTRCSSSSAATASARTKGLAIGGGAGYPTTDDARRVWLASHGDEVGRGARRRAARALRHAGRGLPRRRSRATRTTPLAHHAGYARTRDRLARAHRARRAPGRPRAAPHEHRLHRHAHRAAARRARRRRRAPSSAGTPTAVAPRSQATRDLLAERHGVALEVFATSR